jgi:predicted dehydrogenase
MSLPVSQRPRVGLIGVSGYARIYLQLVRESHDRGELDLVAAVVINPEEEPEAVRDLQRRGAELFDSYEEMLRRHAGRLDLCLVPTGIPWHARMTIAALNVGANVLVEKPLAGSMADVAAIRAAEKASGRFVAVGFQDLYSPAAAHVKARLVDGAIGELRSIRFVGLWPRGTEYFERNHWAGRLNADGASVLDSPLNNAFAHFVNLCLFFAGPERWRSARAKVESAELLRAHAIETFDTAVVRAVSAEGVRFWFGVSHSCGHVREPEIVIEGSAGQAEWWHEQRCLITPTSGPAEERRLPDTSETRRNMFDAVLARLRDPASPICDTAMAECHTALIEDVHHTAKIQPVNTKRIDWLVPPGSPAPVPVVRGLEEALDRAFGQRSPLSATGFVGEAGLAH